MEGTIGEVRLFGGDFAPRAWAFCNGELLSISSNQALFSIVGTTYGGDGRTTFGLPDLRGRVAVHEGTGPGLSEKKLGERSGNETVTLGFIQIPPHTHTGRVESLSAVTSVVSMDDDGNSSDPKNNFPAITESGYMYGDAVNPSGKKMAGDLVSLDKEKTVSAESTISGADPKPHNNMQPFLTLRYIICLQGKYPDRN
ncbi:MAG: tail fiber protein [Cytophagales bacterium]|nr:tail fiber protein [Cytophagales bacterium]